MITVDYSEAPVCDVICNTTIINLFLALPVRVVSQPTVVLKLWREIVCGGKVLLPKLEGLPLCMQDNHFVFNGCPSDYHLKLPKLICSLVCMAPIK